LPVNHSFTLLWFFTYTQKSYGTLENEKGVKWYRRGWDDGKKTGRSNTRSNNGPRLASSTSPSRAQFHQHFTYSFYTHRSQKCKKIQLSHQYLFFGICAAPAKAVRRTLMKFCTGVNFINILRAAFSKVNIQWSYWCTL